MASGASQRAAWARIVLVMCWVEGAGGEAEGEVEGKVEGRAAGGNTLPIPCVATTRRVPAFRRSDSVMASPARRPPP